MEKIINKASNSNEELLKELSKLSVSELYSFCLDESDIPIIANLIAYKINHAKKTIKRNQSKSEYDEVLQEVKFLTFQRLILLCVDEETTAAFLPAIMDKFNNVKAGLIESKSIDAYNKALNEIAIFPEPLLHALVINGVIAELIKKAVIFKHTIEEKNKTLPDEKVIKILPPPLKNTHLIDKHDLIREVQYGKQFK